MCSQAAFAIMWMLLATSMTTVAVQFLDANMVVLMTSLYAFLFQAHREHDQVPVPVHVQLRELVCVRW